MSQQQAPKKKGKGGGTNLKCGDNKEPSKQKSDQSKKQSQKKCKSKESVAEQTQTKETKGTAGKKDKNTTNREEVSGKKDKNTTNREEVAGKKDKNTTNREEVSGKKEKNTTNREEVAGKKEKNTTNREEVAGKKDENTTNREEVVGSAYVSTRDEPHADEESMPAAVIPVPAPVEAIKASEQSLKKMIYELLNTNTHEGKEAALSEGEILGVLDEVREILIRQGPFVQIKAPVNIVGDIHGQFNDLRRILSLNGYPSDTRYLFLGDYVDRGSHSLETITLLFCYKALYPDSLTLLRGNHECTNINVVYGFFDELNRRNLPNLYHEFNDVFDYLPFCALVEKRILCMHGGISALLKNLNELKTLPRPCSMIPPDCPDIALDLLWADPDKVGSGYQKSKRGASYTFGMDVLETFCVRMKVDLIVRAHQVVQKGYERMGTAGGKTRLCTVFSAPNYSNDFDNSAAVMLVGEKLSINFNIIEADASITKEREKERALPTADKFPELDETQKSMSRASHSHSRNAAHHQPA